MQKNVFKNSYLDLFGSVGLVDFHNFWQSFCG